MTKSLTMNSVLLVGNDINNATESYSWADLIKGLLEYASIPDEINHNNKPFPLLYEEIYLKAAQLRNTSESRLKKYIASQTRNLIPNELHYELLDLGINNIFTTNYDLSFEAAAGLKTKNCTNRGYIKESLYNLFRYHQTERHKIWHIHGSQSNPKSITLGYEHYGGYLQQMRNYVASGTRGTYTKIDFMSLIRRLQTGTVNHESWVDYFFTHDIFIKGLNLDFVEMHLWWLLTYRARIRVDKRIAVDNRILYFFPQHFAEKSAHKLEMFKVMGIEPVAIPLVKNNRIKYYREITRQINVLTK